jgi:hypothetical protein
VKRFSHFKGFALSAILFTAGFLFTPQIFADSTNKVCSTQGTLTDLRTTLEQIQTLLSSNTSLPNIRFETSPAEVYLELKESAAETLLENLRKLPLQFANLQQINTRADLQKMIATHPNLYAMARVGNLPIIYFHFNRGRMQGLAFDRIAIFAETPGNRLYSDLEMRRYSIGQSYAGAAGHDYQMTDIAKFFNQAGEKKIELNPLELRIRDELLNLKLLRKDGEKLVATNENAAVTSTNGGFREDFDHELNHGIYFSDPIFRNQIKSLWESFDSKDKDIIGSTLNTLGEFNYDFENNPDLLLREFSAYYNDPEELISSYLLPIGKKTKDPLNPKLYLQDGNLRPEVYERIKQISERLIALETQSNAYSQVYKEFRGLSLEEQKASALPSIKSQPPSPSNDR